MTQLFTLLQLSLSVTLLDVDNALYMTSAIDALPPEQKKIAVRLGLLIEFLIRLVMVIIFGFIASGTEVLFVAFGIEFTAETISLLAAGLFLFVHTTREFIRFLIGKDDDKPTPEENQGKNFSKVLIEMSVVTALLSVDTVIAVTGSAISGGAQFTLVIYLLLFSALIRLLFVQEIAHIIERYPALNIVIMAFLIAISIELIAQGLGAKIPEQVFNGLIIIALGTAVVYQMRYTGPDEPSSQPG